MVIRCSVSLVDLKIWTFVAFRLIVTSPQVSTFSATAESDFGRSALFIILQPVSMIYIFPFPKIVLLKFLIQFFLDVPVLSMFDSWPRRLVLWNVMSSLIGTFWQKAWSAVKNFVEINTSSKTFILSFSQKWPFKDLNYWLNWRAHSDYFPSGSRFLNLHQLHSLPPFSSVWTWFDFLN